MNGDESGHVSEFKYLVMIFSEVGKLVEEFEESRKEGDNAAVEVTCVKQKGVK